MVDIQSATAEIGRGKKDRRKIEITGQKQKCPHLLRRAATNSNTSFTCPRNMVNFGLVTAEICWRVWGTPANSTDFASWQR